MRLTGYCTECRRVKQVEVSGSGMAMVVAGHTPRGICSSCRQEQEDHRLVQSFGLEVAEYRYLNQREKATLLSVLRRRRRPEPGWTMRDYVQGGPPGATS